MEVVKVFLSHNHADKSFTRKLAADLEYHGVKCWIDEAEMKIGDSLIQKIRNGIDESNFFIIVLSPNSIKAPWVINELDVAMNLQIMDKKLKVLPLMYKKCDLPGFLIGKVYSNFVDESQYINSFKTLLKSIDVVYNSNIFSHPNTINNLGSGIDKAIKINLPILQNPFHRPFQYLGLTISRIENLLKVKANDLGNLVIENDECRMYLEAEGNFINFLEIDIKRTKPHFQNLVFDSEPILGCLSISVSELELISKKTHCHIYYDHNRRIKVSVGCMFDEAPISVAFCTKYYGM
jgi:TIR domain